MKVSSVWNSAVVGLATVVFGAAWFGWSQYAPAGIQSLPNPRGGGRFGETSDPDSIFGDKRMNALNTDRQKSMVSDADKLVKLARELDAEIASNTTGDLTGEELHKIAEIEKLARSVKAKMAQSFGPGPQFHQPQIPLNGPGRQ